MIKKIFWICLLFGVIGVTYAAEQIDGDLVSSPPVQIQQSQGMLGSIIYSGYLNTTVENRFLHYIFLKANLSDANAAPLTIWFNGGPGCSSLIGWLQQIGPYLVDSTYKQGDLLKKNDFSWDKASNLLFIESPGIVGFSSDRDVNFEYTDPITANDAFVSIKHFIFNKTTNFTNSPLFITGQSYAGKYIPDVTELIIANNNGDGTKYINIQGILVGNGVMDFRDFSLQKSSIQYMEEHGLLSSHLSSIYQYACGRDFHSPRCRFFRYEFDLLRAYINHYNIYEVCQSRPTEAIRMLESLSSLSYDETDLKEEGVFRQPFNKTLGEIPDCPLDQGMVDYLNLNKVAFKVDKFNKTWSVCSRLRYTRTQAGSMKQYAGIFLNKAIRVWFMNGDWDDVVPYPDTEKNLEIMSINRTVKKVGDYAPWFVGEHHAGFYQLYQTSSAGVLTVVTVKGASHMVPQAKPKASYQLFYNFIKNRPVNTPVDM